MAVTINGSGQVPVQVIQTVKTDVFTTTSTSYVDITGFSVSITPSSSNSKILVMVDAVIANSSGVNYTFTQLLRNSTVIYAGAQAGLTGVLGVANYNSYLDSITQDSSGIYLDSPATTSTVTYKLQMRVNASTGVFNRVGYNPQNVSRAASITVMEVSL